MTDRQSNDPSGVADKVKKTMKKARLRQRAAEQGVPTSAKEVRNLIAPIAARRGPVLVGPFTGEVGFELLYWRPIIRWLMRELPGLRGRLVIVSRGGVRQWWESTMEILDYVDILSLIEPAEYVSKKGPDKQRRGPSEFDLEIIEKVKRQFSLDEADLIHPSVLFEFYYHQRKRSSFAFVEALRPGSDGTTDGLAAIYERIPLPEVNGELAGLLPERYVAVRFYSRESFPNTPENHEFAADMTERLSRSLPIVLLNNSMELDEHGDFQPESNSITRVDHLMRPDNNLAVQTAVLSRASAYVGTYGGLSYLAPFLGTPSIGFSAIPNQAKPWHLALASTLFAGDGGWGSLVTLANRDVDLLQLVS